MSLKTRISPCRASLTAALMLLAAPAGAICWGSLHVDASTSQLNPACPTPTHTRTWDISCKNACGYTTNSFSKTLQGFGECYRRFEHCKMTVCKPEVGQEVYGYSPPSIDASTWNRHGEPESGCFAKCVRGYRNKMHAECTCEPEQPRDCGENDPVCISLTDDYYQLTDLQRGVAFDLNADGSDQQVPWTAIEGDEAFLALDRNGNGYIDDGFELFGDVTPQHPSPYGRNGFEALRILDDSLNGGNENGRIDPGDTVFSSLLLWRDANHDGTSDPNELFSLYEADLLWIDLDYEPSSRIDEFGNEFRFFADVGWTDGSVRPAWDVFLLAE